MREIYSQGVTSDGPVILCDGLPITPDMIVETLNRLVKINDEYYVALNGIDDILQTTL